MRMERENHSVYRWALTCFFFRVLIDCFSVFPFIFFQLLFCDTELFFLSRHIYPVFIGSGKTALLCNWIDFHSRTCPEDIIVYHFIGCATDTTGKVICCQLMEGKWGIGEEND